MEKMPQNNQENNLDKQIEIEKNILGNNVEEISSLVSEKKEGGSFTDKAKLLASKAGRVAGVGIATAGTLGILGTTGLTLAEVAEHTEGMGIPRIPEHTRGFLLNSMNITAFVTLIGAFGADKCEKIIQNIKSKLKSEK